MSEVEIDPQRKFPGYAPEYRLSAGTMPSCLQRESEEQGLNEGAASVRLVVRAVWRRSIVATPALVAVLLIAMRSPVLPVLLLPSSSCESVTHS